MKMDAIPTVGVLVFHDGAVLLVKHGEKASHLTGVYGVPGGRFQDNETQKQAAVRELEEETGLIALEEDLVSYPDNVYTATIRRKSGEIKRFTSTVFICNAYSGVLRATDETAPEWVHISELDKYNLLPNVKKMVEDGKRYLGTV